MATGKQNRDFESDLFEDAPLLDRAINWIGNNLSIGDVFSQSQIKDHVGDGDPEDYFSASRLQLWADENGYELVRP